MLGVTPSEELLDEELRSTTEVTQGIVAKETLALVTGKPVYTNIVPLPLTTEDTLPVSM